MSKEDGLICNNDKTTVQAAYPAIDSLTFCFSHFDNVQHKDPSHFFSYQNTVKVYEYNKLIILFRHKALC